MDDSTANAAYLAHFTDPLYASVSEEFAPFGSDEGSDILYEWERKPDEITNRTRLRDLIPDWEPGDPARLDLDDISFVLGAGFTLLRLTGRIGPGGLTLVLGALDALLRTAPAESAKVQVMRRDLLAFVGTRHTEGTSG